LNENEEPKPEPIKPQQNVSWKQFKMNKWTNEQINKYKHKSNIYIYI
jgi:predicted DNA-binding transcriptional regulator AlpA